MIKNPLRLSYKMFFLLWFFLIINVLLKVTFDYWQPYVIPTPQLERLGNFIDSHRWIQATLNGIFYLINGIFVILCCIQQWWFKNKKQTISVIVTIIICFLLNVFLNMYDYTPFITTIILPLIINFKKWLWVILTFIISNVFMIISLWLEGFISADNMNYIIRMLFQGDYYIMLGLNYILFNLIRMKKEMKQNG